MTRHLVLLMIGALGLVAGIAGCAQLPWMEGTDAPPVLGPRPTVMPPGAFTTATEASPKINPPYPTMVLNDLPATPAPLAAQAGGMVPPPIARKLPSDSMPQPVPPVAVPPVTVPPVNPQPTVTPPPLTQTGPPASASVPAQPVALDGQGGRDQLLDILDAAKRGAPIDDYLKNYDPATRQQIEKLLAVLRIIFDRRAMVPAEVDSVQAHLDEFKQLLLPKTDLVIANVCFCEWAKAFGNYQPLAEGHVFHASSGGRPGERVQLYVEVRNFESVNKPDGFFETRLSSMVEICDSKGKPVWSHSFDDKGHAIRSRSQLHDYFNNYSFHLPPQLVHGTYTLTIRVTDQTRPEAPRAMSKSITFKVGAGQK